MRVQSTHDRPEITYEQMETFLHHGWGTLGRGIARTWQTFNALYFNKKLTPLPIVLTATSPYGHWLGCTHCSLMQPRAHLIELTMPRGPNSIILVADKGVLLHEMIHQHLAEQGRKTSHDSEDWCLDVMRVHFLATGERLWIAPEKISKIKARSPINGALRRRSVRVQSPDPETGAPSLPQKVIASWPRSVGLSFGDF